jgi:hypothetical protein
MNNQAPASGEPRAGELRAAREAIERFVASSKEPAVFEPGEDPIRISGANHLLEWRSGYLTLQVWTDARSISRRITGVARQARAQLDVTIERFGKRTGTLSLIDLGAPRALETGRRAARMTYRELFRRALSRQFPGWRLSDLTSEADLEHSLSPRYPRALLRRGATAWAAIGAPPGDAVNGILTFGLIWLDYLRARERRLTVEGLALFLPAGDLTATCLRLEYMNRRAAQFAVFAHCDDGYEERVDAADFGNLETRLERCRSHAPERRAHIDEWLEVIGRQGDVERIARGDGSTSLRVRGLEFARATDRELLWGIDGKRPAAASDLREIGRLAVELSRLRSAGSPDRANPLYTKNVENWLESQVRRELSEIDATLIPSPVYGQAPTFTAGDRDIIDLLAVDHAGRLAVLELKAVENIHLPLQALDYWMRVKHHAERGEFIPMGYFPGTQLRAQPPRLLLVAPALAFHPANDTVLRYLDPSVDVTRIGVGMEWRTRIKVMFRYDAN